MILLVKLYEKKIVLVLLIVSLFFWSIVSTYFALTTEQKIVLLKMDKFGTSLIQDANAESPNIEVENFLNTFINYFYTYTSVNYEAHIEQSLFYLNNEVTQKHVPLLNKMYDKVKIDLVSQVAVAEKITRLSESSYEVEMAVYRIVRDKNSKELKEDSEDHYKLVIDINKADRTRENVYGLEIIDLNEHSI